MQRVGKGKLPATLGLRRSEPQPHEVPSGRWRLVVGVSCARVQDVRVGNELNVADLEDHVQGEAHAGLLQDARSLLLRFAEGWDFADVAEALERVHVVRVPFAVHAGGFLGSGFLVEDGLASVRLLAGGDFAFTVEIPDGLCEGFGNVGMLPLKGIPDIVDGDDVRLATLQGASNAKQADDVAIVGVEELTCTSAVDAHLVDLCRVGADVLDVTEHMAEAVLADKVAQVGTKSHVCDGGLVVAPLCDWKAFEQEKSLAVDDIVAKIVEELFKLG